MAAREVTPQVVKDILSSFLVTSDKTETAESLPDDGTVGDEDRETSAEKIHRNPSAHSDRNAFTNRVESYTTLNWFAKPVEFSPLVCARYGWENMEADMLKCVSCKSMLCGQLRTSQNPQVYRECHRKLKESLIAAHTELCPWRSNPSPESFFTVVFHSQRETLDALTDIYFQLVKMQEKLPDISFQTLDEIGVDEVSLQSRLSTESNRVAAVPIPVCATVFKDHPVNLSAFCLALFGWRKSQSQPEILVCERCRRQVGLWNFTAPETGGSDVDIPTVTHSPGTGANEHSNMTEGGDVDVPTVAHSPGTGANGHGNMHREFTNEEPKAKRRKLSSTRQNFDPIAEHKVWCPWLNVATDYSLHSSSNSSHIYRATNLAISPDSRTPSTKQSFNQSHCTSVTDQSLNTVHGSFNQSGNFSTPVSNQKPGQERILAWQMALYLLSLWQPETFSADCPDIKNSPPVEGMRHIRKILREWTSPKSRQKLVTQTEDPSTSLKT